MNDFSSPKVLLRRAIARDKADVLEFTKFIWEGHDYISYVWDDWYMDPDGFLVIAEYGGHAVGMGKVSRVSKGQWWLEGLRVDPKYQGLKIGTRLHEYLQDWWQEYGGGTIRLMTSWERVEVHHLCERFGWQKVGEVKAHRGRSLAGEPPGLHPVAESELGAALRFAQAHLDYANGLADLDWKDAAVDEEMLREALSQENLLWWRGKPGRANEPAGLVCGWVDVDEEDDQPFLGLAFMACEVASLTDMLLDVRRLAAQRGFANVYWHVPARPDVEEAVHQAGLVSRWDGSAYLYEKK